ncbi:MAG TPA: hypothetical protein VLA92_02705 [Candidatus Saccharimonadales bacterium]|nr:hypothetical protein [Candidatus Saccharimonadales bacterium]
MNMRISPELAVITNQVNRNIPEHGRGLIRPNDMLLTGKANCFGRLALIGAALIDNSTPESRIFFLISHTHALPFGDNRHWFGHAALAIDTPEFVLVDAKKHAFHRDLLLSTNWASGHTSEDTIVDFDKMPKSDEEPINWDDYPGLEKFTGPPHIHAVQHQFSVYSYSDGLATYQASHPFYYEPYLDMADYIDGYRKIEAPEDIPLS